ncbi:MAG: nickel pincer cofactor biosynthesis protein LarC [Candidatus Aenigmatarchaeota archaeon]
MKNKIVFIDCQVAGISGDMFLAALLDLGADEKRIIESMKKLQEYLSNCKNLEIKIEKVERKGFLAKRIEIKAEEPKERKGKEIVEAVENCVEDLGLNKEAKDFSIKCAKTLVETEARIHGKSIDEVHLHEAGSIDTVAEIIGSAVALVNLNLFDAEIYSSPVALGGGMLSFSHGIVSVPSPAALEILKSKNFSVKGGPISAELTTPTGASILVNLAKKTMEFLPLLKLINIGYGAGTKDFEEIPNILRVIVGNSTKEFLSEKILEIETNLDDVSGEILGYTVKKLFEEGAKDVSVIPTIMKKNRPGQIIKVITDETNLQKIAGVLMRETGTLGVRIHPCERLKVKREIFPLEVEIDGIKEKVNVKVSRDLNNQIIQAKPEYDDLEKIAKKTKKSLREISEIVKSKVRESFGFP